MGTWSLWGVEAGRDIGSSFGATVRGSQSYPPTLLGWAEFGRTRTQDFGKDVIEGRTVVVVEFFLLFFEGSVCVTVTLPLGGHSISERVPYSRYLS